MSRDFFDQEEFRDEPEEVSGLTPNEILQQQPVSAPQPRRAALPPPAQVEQVAQEYDVSEYTEEVEDEDDYTAVLSDARLRLEQGRLYEMILNHDLFGDTDADPAAAKSVQKQIRKFAKEQMEIMLGMRRETAKVEHLEIDFPFNAVEVKVLKMIAHKASGGTSETSDKYVPEVKRTTQEVPVISEKKQTFTPIGGKKPVPAKPAPTKVSAPVAPQPSALRQNAQRPIERKQQSNTPDTIVVEGEVITKSQIDAQYDPSYTPLDKPLHKLSSEELLRRNQESASRVRKQAKSPDAKPMPTFEQEQMLHLTRATENTGKSNAVSLIMAAINNKNQ